MQNSDVEQKELDEYEKALEVQLLKLQECQSQKKLDSCMKCDLLLDCEVRNEYVKAVYMSMNKGVTGGFEF